MSNKSNKFCQSLSSYIRRKSSVVNIGGIEVGGDNPIRVQSMTTTNTMDTVATVEQSIRMINAGCEYVRITAPSIKEAENLKNIKTELKKRGYFTPLIADIHFTPRAAEVASKYVEKIRINPGNFVDRKKFEVHEYTDEQYNIELEKINDKFSPLVNLCLEEGTAMRIGTNHGSLSDRILSRYGDTPLGMVESALEFIRICEDNNYHDIILSMKSSNPLVMVHAYRLLVNKMDAENMHYPLHLGVTEAGEGEDGRIKSALGIGTLLSDGIGDTIRVSLTEEPEFEIPVAKQLVKPFNDSNDIFNSKIKKINYIGNPYEYHRRDTIQIKNIGSKSPPIVVSNFLIDNPNTHHLSDLGFNYLNQLDKWSISEQSPDFLFCKNTNLEIPIPGELRLFSKKYLLYFKFLALNELKSFCENTNGEFVIILELNDSDSFQSIRSVLFNLKEKNLKFPIIFKKNYKNNSLEEVQLLASYEIGGLFLEGFGDGLWLTQNDKNLNKLSFNILQATRTRISKTEYISCPSCGRTLFDLQETTAKIRAKTDHLKGLKIGIMGCIVNGPGEMADADFGYVGTGENKISLYKGQEVVKKNIPSENAVDSLIELIKDNNAWTEPNY
ncbi:MAG: 4-hydroxy-3-methylbut-2-en-1-yl diphosphate synthase [Candidatus Marinimicrobia bacterium]|nr:4-hydroxy-3-methylbut-2-en-1-yl diphosphate synthase [Candidatus Neomarinimicrobiota bacterium]|tara:strand:+ start:717 stop:2552 length:1836 start_codon:yes stop_codon:yes gene_type:complete